MRYLFSLPVALAYTGSLLAAAGDTSQPGTPLARPVIARVQQTAGDIYGNLKSFVCDEHIQRFRSAGDRGRPKPIDVITAALSFENGAEQYSNIYQNAERIDRMASIPGAWSEGEFGSLLRQTAELLDSQVVTYTGAFTENGVAFATYSFDTSAADSPWELAIGSRAYRVPFRTEISVSADTGQVLRIARRTLGLNPEIGISEIDWSVTLNRTRLQGADWVLPASADYSVSYAQRNRREWNRITFDHYRRYGAEVALRFEGQ